LPAPYAQLAQSAVTPTSTLDQAVPLLVDFAIVDPPVLSEVLATAILTCDPASVLPTTSDQSNAVGNVVPVQDVPSVEYSYIVTVAKTNS
jgi:hypothetical protein